MIPDAHQGQEQPNIFPDIALLRLAVNRCCSLQKVHDRIKAQVKSEHHRADHRRGTVPAADIVIHIERSQIRIGIVHGALFTRHRNAVSRWIETGPLQSQPDMLLISQCFQGSTAFGNDIDQCCRQIDFGQHRRGVIGIDIGDKTNLSP